MWNIQCGIYSAVYTVRYLSGSLAIPPRNNVVCFIVVCKCKHKDERPNVYHCSVELPFNP